MNTDDLLNEFLGKPKPPKSELDAQTKEFVQPTKRDPLVQEFIKPSVKTQKDLTPVATIDEQGTPVVSREGYSQDDLVSDEFFEPIAEYMKVRFGSQSIEGDREEVVNKFLNNMRGFAGGNSVRAVNEISFLNSVESDREQQAAAKAYAIYDKMEGLFGDTTGREKAEIVKDFVGSAILDPVNLVSLGIGKLASSGGVRLASQAAQKAATKEFVKRGSLEGAKKVFVAQTSAIQAKTLADIAKRETAKQTVASTVKQKLTSVGAKEIYATGAIDGAAAAMTDYMWQNAMIRTGVQQDYNKYQTGIAAVSSIAVMGTIAGVSQLGRRTTTVGPERFKVETKGVDISELSKSIKSYLGDNVGKADAPDVVPYTREGIELESADSDFFITMMLGDDKAGIKGLGHILEEQGYAWEKRDADDTITKFLADVIQDSDPQGFKEVLKDFSEYTGTSIKELENVTPERFAKVFKEKMSYQGAVFNAASQVAKRLGIDEGNVTLEHFLDYAITGKLPRGKSFVDRKASGLLKAMGLPEGAVSAVQNRLIRLLVTNPSTSALNVTGFAFASTMNTATDVAMAFMNAGTQVMKSAVGKGSLKAAKKELMDAYGTTMFKLANTLDPSTTIDMFKKYAIARPNAVRELTRVLPGGVENIEKIAKDFDPSMTLTGLRADAAIDTLQTLSLVTAQDSVTKSIEFMTQLDKLIRKKYGMSYTKFMQQDNYARLMQTREYAMLELQAADDTLSTIFSKSYKDPGTPLGEIAGFIEDARNLPGIGMLVPFGRFFNNTVAFIADHSYISLAGRIFKEPKSTTYTSKELFVRGTISLVAVNAMVDREKDAIDKGLSWSQEEQFDGSGAVIDEKFEFPYAAYKAAARIMAYHERGEDVPPEVAKDIFNTFFGQLTRNLNASGQGITDIITTLLSLDGPEITRLVRDSLGKIVSQGVASGTRFMEPVNIAVGLARGDDFKIPDNKQGMSLFRESTKYMNQIIDVISGGDMEEKFSATQGSLQQQSSKSFSTVREVDMTDLERVFNQVGVPNYMATPILRDAPEAKNRYSQLFNQMNQATATALLKNPMWKNGDLETRKSLFSKFAEKNKKRVMSLMKTGIGSGDTTATLLIDLEENYGSKKIRSGLRDLSIDKKLEEMDYQELFTLEQYLKTKEDLLKLKVLPK